MAAQAALIADTIVGMKRALRNENDNSGPDEPITQPTNRGNKLRGNARYVKEGAMGYVHAEGLYKQKIEHAGYTRYVLNHNPIRYDSEGDELDDDDEDSEADAAVAEENPFSEIALEHFLCPLKHPSELPTHPSLSHAYTSKALSHMTLAIEAKLRLERALLWRARNLHRQFLGDGGWAPCGLFETFEDRFIFGPQIASTRHSSPLPQYGADGANSGHKNASTENNTQNPSSTASLQEAPSPHDVEANDVEMTVESTEGREHAPRHSDDNAPKEPKSEVVDTSVGDLPHHSETREDGVKANGGSTESQGNQERMSGPGRPNNVAKGEETKEHAFADPEIRNKDGREEEADEDVDMENGLSPEPPRRMTTRAQTNAGQPPTDSGRASPSASSDTLSSLPIPHPLYLVPDSVRPDPNNGLPPHEAEETRRLLWSYVQKQEETVRGFEHMLETLLRALRMKEDVFEWCKAEGHVGEMSDGEDWYDREKWGLAEGEDLKKGADEDEIETVEESRSNKRGRGRRA
ncbi:RXT2 domain-containing protein [Aspergillus undulatus]|uniref:RXT2 domain-containing protein n=1 Tax=Aspergillus undulatus TaxID=1810928 RepID=UPI003CCD4BAE